MSNYNVWIESGVWALSILILYALGRNRWRETAVSFLFMQLLTWPCGILAVEFNGLIYPSRFFAEALNTSFTYEFIALPSVGALFNLYFPNRSSPLRKAGYVLLFATVLTLGEVILERYTELVRYIHWSWFLSWTTIGAILYANYRMYRWFLLPYKHNVKKQRPVP